MADNKLKINITEEQLTNKLEEFMNKFANESSIPKIGLYGTSIEAMEILAQNIFVDFYQNCCYIYETYETIDFTTIDVLWTFKAVTAPKPSFVIENMSEYSIVNLIEWTEYSLMKRNKGAFVKYQKVHLDLKEKYANKAIAQHSTGAFAVGFIPNVPVSDSLILVSSEIALLGRILNVYGLEDIHQFIKTVGFSTLMGQILTVVGKSAAGGLVKIAGSAIGGAVGWAVTSAINGTVATAVTVAFGKSISKVVKQLCHASITRNLEQFQYIEEHFGDAVHGTAANCLEQGLLTVEDYEKSGFDNTDLSFEQLKNNIEKGNKLFQEFLDKNTELDNQFQNQQIESEKLSSDMWDAINKI